MTSWERSDIIKKYLSYLSRFTPLIKFYGHVLTISIGSIFYGLFLILNQRNVVERVVLFPAGFSVIFGSTMMLVSTIKIFAVFKHGSKIKKYALITITLCWLTIGWAYLINRTQNHGFIMAFTITALCYIELWRGDFDDD